MKRPALVLLLALLMLCTTACGRWIKDNYLSVEPHVEQPLPTQETTEPDQPPVVTNRNELRGAVLSLIRNWTERASIIVKDYDGDLSVDLSETVTYATQEDPIGAYAVDYADAELTGDAKRGSIELSIVFRRSASEIASIVTVSGNSTACQRIQQALNNYETALTLRIRNYQETDFEAYVRNYCLENPDTVLCLPETSASLYPREGETRILELHFSYPGSRDEMRVKLSSVRTILSSASSYIRSGENDAERAALLFRFLTTRFDYEIGEDEPSMPAYRLLCEGVAHSLSFASVFSAECRAADIDCLLVSGTRNGTAHSWNMLCLDGVYYHIDLMRSIEKGEAELTLLSAKTLREEGYVWDESAYPITSEPDVQASPSLTTPNGEAVEPTDQTISSEPTEALSEAAGETETTVPTEEISPSGETP